MSRRPAPSPQRGLFGELPGGRDESLVWLPMVEVHSGTDRAWFLKPKGVSSAKAGFAPRSLVKRGEGDRQQFFQMPRWLAAERGWA